MKTTFRFRLTPIPTTAASAFALLIATSLLVQAQPNPDRPNRPDSAADGGRRMQRPPQGPDFQPGGPGGFRGGQGLPMMEQILTEDQRDSFRQTMEAQREKMREFQEKIRDARKAMMAAAFAEDYKEETVRAKALEVAKLEADLTVMRLKTIADVQPALSKEQVEKILNPQPPQRMQPGDNDQRPNRRPNRRSAGPPNDDARPPRDPQ